MSHFPRQPCNFKKWLLFDSWPHDQAAFILLGYEPPPLEYLRHRPDPYDPWAESLTCDVPKEVANVILALKTSIAKKAIPFLKITEWPYETYHITPADLVRWATHKSCEIPDELKGFIEQAASTDIDADAEFGRSIRAQRADMGKLRHAEGAEKARWWKPYIDEGRKLVAAGKSKSNAARIVAKNHPSAHIKHGTLRQKL